MFGIGKSRKEKHEEKKAETEQIINMNQMCKECGAPCEFDSKKVSEATAWGSFLMITGGFGVLGALTTYKLALWLSGVPDLSSATCTVLGLFGGAVGGTPILYVGYRVIDPIKNFVKRKTLINWQKKCFKNSPKAEQVAL